MSVVFFDSPEDAVEFADTVTTIDVQTEVNRAKQSVAVEICTQLRDPALQTSSVVLPMIVAQELAAFHLENGTSSSIARCAAIAHAKTVAFDLDLEGFDGYDPYFNESAPFLERCR